VCLAYNYCLLRSNESFLLRGMLSFRLYYNKFRLKSAVRELAFDAIADAISSYQHLRGNTGIELEFDPECSYSADSTLFFGLH
jgi:hypothetical protein